MKKRQNLDFEFYIPSCNEKNCNGILSIDFDLNDFRINYQCSKNKNHKGEKIFFQTFERYHLKKKKIKKCYRCLSNLQNEYKYKCNYCKNIYCPDCYIYDKHISNNIERNLIKKSKKCQIHKCTKNNYCFDCCKNVCSFCIKDNACEGHKIRNILDVIPSAHQINSLNNKIKDNKNYIIELLKSIDKWKTKLVNKINLLKQNLKNQVIIFEKIISNFNQNYMNYAYHSNFQNFNKFLETINNKALNEFYNSVSFKDKTQFMMEILLSDGVKVKQKSGVLKELEEKEGKIAKINEQYFFYNLYHSKKVEVSYYNKNIERICFYKNSCIDFKDKIYSISFSSDKQKVYACLLDKKVVKIFDLSLEKINMKISPEEINDMENKGINDHFYKCIELIFDLVATEDNNSINIWKKNYFNKFYTNEINIKFDEKPYDLLLVSYDCFISSLYDSHKIVFLDINMEEPKITQIISEIDSIDSDNCLILFEKYIIVNCVKGIAIIFVETKELVQYIINYEGFNNKMITVSNDEYIYILNCYQNILIMKLKFDEGCLIPIEEYKNIEIISNKLNDKFDSTIENICTNNGNIIVWGKYIYILKENDNN